MGSTEYQVLVTFTKGSVRSKEMEPRRSSDAMFSVAIQWLTIAVPNTRRMIGKRYIGLQSGGLKGGQRTAVAFTVLDCMPQ
jgi:hypothetical protein